MSTFILIYLVIAALVAIVQYVRYPRAYRMTIWDIERRQRRIGDGQRTFLFVVGVAAVAFFSLIWPIFIIYRWVQTV